MPEPVVVMASRRTPRHAPEAEPVVIDVGPRVAILTLDDGVSLTFDALELLAALGVPPAGQARNAA